MNGVRKSPTRNKTKKKKNKTAVTCGVLQRGGHVNECYLRGITEEISVYSVREIISVMKLFKQSTSSAANV